MREAPIISEEAPGDGGEIRTRENDLTELKRVIDEIRADIAENVVAIRRDYEDVRYCRWSGQSTDGRKHAAELGEEPRPFEGASDARVRVSDKVINEHVKEMVSAAMRAIPRVIGIESNDDRAAGKVQYLLKWWLKNQLGSEYRRQVELLANWMESDVPAVSIAMCDWHEEKGVEYRKLSREEFLALALANSPPDDGAAALDMVDLTANPERVEELANTFLRLLPQLRPARARKMAKEMQAEGEAEYPYLYDRCAFPRIKALRVYEDVFYPPNTRDLNRARVVFLREWLSRAEVLERAETEEWAPSFVSGLLGDDEYRSSGHEGKSGFDDFSNLNVVSDRLNATGEVEPFKGMYEVIRVFTRLSNDDGILAPYTQVFSYYVETPATPMQPFARKHGKYPFVAFARESLTNRLNDSRSVNEVTATSQFSQKRLMDSFEDHVQLTVVPPVKVPIGRPFSRLNLSPLGQVPASVRDDIKYMEPPEYPSAAAKYWDEVRRELNEYHGRVAENIPPQLTILHSQDRVDRFLGSLTDVLALGIQLFQEFLTDEKVQRIVGGRGLPIARSVEEIQGKYDVHLSYDVRDIDMDYIVKKAEIALKYGRPLDARAQVQWERIAGRILESIDPNWAEEVLPAEMADEREVREEQQAFAMMVTGIEPAMPDGGINAGLRLQVLEAEVLKRAENPAAYAPLSPMSRALIANRRKYLQFQVQQQQNAQIGRVGAVPVEPGDVEAEVAGGAA